MEVRRILPPALVAVAASLLLAQSAAAAPPSGADFSSTWAFSPPLTRPLVGQIVDFNGSVTAWGGADGTFSWSFGDGATAPGAHVTHAYSSFGANQVTMTATNGAVPSESVSVTKTVFVNAPPTAAFSWGPTSPFAGQEVKFASDSDDPDGEIKSYNWAFGDGVTSQIRSPTHPYGTPGFKTVTLTITDAFGAQSSLTQDLAVQGALVGANTPPVASFAFSPRKPKVGQQVEFVSSAIAAPGGRLTDQRWDLDGDGQFDDARGDVVLETYTTPGPHVVRLRVTDAAGGAAVRERIVPVEAQIARAGFLNPFPVVRVTGEVRRSGTLIRLLGVRAPRGTLVRVACTGRGCPAKVRRLTVGKSHAVRFRTFERLLRAGVRLEVFVRRAGTIGKYTRFAVRAGASPRRTDSCLLPGKAKPVRCPS